MKKFTFPKNRKITTNKDFKAILDHKRFFRDEILTVYICPKMTSISRLGVSVGKKYGSATTRNRLKRLAREAFRLSQHHISPDFDYLLIYNPKMTKNRINTLKTDEVQASLTELLINAGLCENDTKTDS